MSTMKARFYVGQILTSPSGKKADGTFTRFGTVTLHAVTRETGDNIDWAQATPSGKLELNVKESALVWFEKYQGEDVYLDMVPIEPGK